MALSGVDLGTRVVRRSLVFLMSKLMVLSLAALTLLNLASLKSCSTVLHVH